MDSMMLIGIIAVVLLLGMGLLIATIVIVIVVSRNKKQKQMMQQQYHMPPVQPNYQVQQPQPAPPVNIDDDQERTQSLFSSPVRPAQSTEYAPIWQTNIYSIHISETSPAGERNYEVHVNDQLTIGRAGTSGLVMYDKTVSGLQCTLTSSPEGVFIENNSGSNITQLNGIVLTGIHPIKTGDIIKMGKAYITINNIQKLS